MKVLVETMVITAILENYLLGIKMSEMWKVIDKTEKRRV
jgi:hypothetical protein